MKVFTGVLLFIFCSLLFSCNDTKSVEKKAAGNFPVFDSITASITRVGVVGIYYVPEIPVMAISDSSAVSGLSQKVAEAYMTLGNEMNEIGAVQGGPLGQVMYNSDTSNFRFDCFCPIKDMPPKKPKRCKLVLLPGGDMLVYNYYGPYQQLYLAYDVLKKYLSENYLEQREAMREFYVTDPNSEPDNSKWLTRIMVPVKVPQ